MRKGMREPTWTEVLESAYLLVLVPATVGAVIGLGVGELCTMIVQFFGVNVR